MCGWYSYFGPLSILKERINLDTIDEEPSENYNIAPTQKVPAILRDETGTHLKHLRWGLIPFWAKDPSVGSRMINARMETLSEKRSFKNPFKKRCRLILANGYYEWTGEKGDKQPYFINIKTKELFCFAGLWETWCSKEDETANQPCMIITTEAGPEIAHLHHRCRLPCLQGNMRNGLILNSRKPEKRQKSSRMGSPGVPFLCSIKRCQFDQEQWTMLDSEHDT